MGCGCSQTMFEEPMLLFNESHVTISVLSKADNGNGTSTYRLSVTMNSTDPVYTYNMIVGVQDSAGITLWSTTHQETIGGADAQDAFTFTTSQLPNNRTLYAYAKSFNTATGATVGQQQIQINDAGTGGGGTTDYLTQAEFDTFYQQYVSDLLATQASIDNNFNTLQDQINRNDDNLIALGNAIVDKETEIQNLWSSLNDTKDYLNSKVDYFEQSKKDLYAFITEVQSQIPTGTGGGSSFWDSIKNFFAGFGIGATGSLIIVGILVYILLVRGKGLG